ncbi:MAG: ankyrin repeat domain-containing protein, partial [Nocardioidaceae bacterium]
MRRLVAGSALGLVLAGCSTGTGATGASDAADPVEAGGVATPHTSTAPPPASGGPGHPPDAAPAPRLSREQQLRLNRRLVQAAWDDDVERARRLVTRGADVDWRDETRQSAFLVATSEGHLELLDLTLAHGADVNLHDSFDGTGLIRAAERGHWRVVGRLVRTGVDVDHVNNLGWVALHEAIILGDGSQRYVDTVRALVAGGADLTITPKGDGVAPVEHARARGQQAVVATLTRALAGRPVTDPGRALLTAAR